MMRSEYLSWENHQISTLLRLLSQSCYVTQNMILEDDNVTTNVFPLASLVLSIKRLHGRYLESIFMIK